MSRPGGGEVPVTFAITAMGVVFPGGKGEGALLELLRSGASRIAPAASDPRIAAAEIATGLKDLVRRKGLASLSRGALLAAAGIEDLLGSIPGAVLDEPPGSCALVSGTAYGHLASKAEFHAAARRDGTRLVSPIVFPNTLINSLAGHAAILFGLRGPNSTVTSGRRSGLEAVLRAGTLLRAGRASRALAIGSDAVSPALLRGLAAASGANGVLPPREAAAAVLIERPEDASGRRTRALLSGTGESSAVGRGLADAVEEAMRAALDEARLEPRGVSWVSIGTGAGEALDAAELEAVERVFGRATPLHAPKAVFGEGFGSSGAIAVVSAVVAGLGASMVPATPPSPGGRIPGGFGFSESPRPASPGPILVSTVEETGATCLVLGR